MRLPVALLLVITLIGACAFGLVMGWVTYRTLRRSQVSGLSDIATVIGAVGGAAVTALFEKGTGSFGAYCIGLALGFFLYLKNGKEPDAPDWLGGNVDHLAEALARRLSGTRSGGSGVARPAGPSVVTDDS